MLDVLDQLGDQLGPEKVLYVYEPSLNLKGVLVIDNTARGLAKGGLRIAPDVNVDTMFRLARAMTYKLSMAEIPWGGAKSGIVASAQDPNKEKLIRAFARAIKEYVPEKYIIGIDMGVTEMEIAAAVDELDDLRVATGKPAFMGGIPPYQLGITGYGVAEAVEIASGYQNLELKGSKAVVQGCGWVGKGSLRNLVKKGITIVAVSDSKGAVYDADGIDVEELIKVKEETGAVKNYPRGQYLEKGQELELQADILVLGAKEDVIGEHNVNRVKARVILEGANLPVPKEMEEWLYQKGVKLVPDFVANMGGAIAAWTESIGGTEEDAFKLVHLRVRKNTELVMKMSEEKGINTRIAALAIARGRVEDAMKVRGRSRCD